MTIACYCTRVPVTTGPYVRSALLEVLLDRAAPAVEASLRAFEAEHSPLERAQEAEFYPTYQRVFQELSWITPAWAPPAARRNDVLLKLHATLPVTTSDWLAGEPHPERYALLEDCGAQHYITTHRSPADALKFSAGIGVAEDWLPVELIDLDLDLSWTLKLTTPREALPQPADRAAWRASAAVGTALHTTAAPTPASVAEGAAFGVKYSEPSPQPAAYDRSHP
jgi:hypothetical protein